MFGSHAEFAAAIMITNLRNIIFKKTAVIFAVNLLINGGLRENRQTALENAALSAEVIRAAAATPETLGQRT